MQENKNFGLTLFFVGQTDRHTDRQTDTQTDRKTDRQTIWADIVCLLPCHNIKTPPWRKCPQIKQVFSIHAICMQQCSNYQIKPVFHGKRTLSQTKIIKTQLICLIGNACYLRKLLPSSVLVKQLLVEAALRRPRRDPLVLNSSVPFWNYSFYNFYPLFLIFLYIWFFF